MNRPRKHNTHLPRGMYLRHGAYYFVRNGKWENLGRELPAALKIYADRIDAPKGSMSALIERVVPALRRIDGDALAYNTERSYRFAAAALKKSLAEFAPEDVKQRHVMLLKRGMSGKPAFANTCLTVLRLVFAYAVEESLVDVNPVVGVRPYRPRKRDRLLSVDEYRAIYSKAAPRLQVIMDLCIRTGQRISDVLKIRRADLLPEGIRFQQQKTKAKGIVPWTPELRAVVERAKTLDAKVSSLTLLHDRTGKAPTYWTTREAWVLACRKAGVKNARIHDMRAFAATWAKKQGKNARALLMHASDSQTDRYLRDKSEPMVEGPSFDADWTQLDNDAENSGK